MQRVTSNKRALEVIHVRLQVQLRVSLLTSGLSISNLCVHGEVVASVARKNDDQSLHNGGKNRTVTSKYASKKCVTVTIALL